MKTTKITLLLTLTFLLTGCVDIYEHISLDDHNNIVANVIMTMSKSIVAMAESQGSFDWNDTLKNAKRNYGAVVTSVQEVEIGGVQGLTFQAVLDPTKVETYQDLGFMPIATETGYSMKVPVINTSTSTSNAYTNMMVSGFSYKFSISKKVMGTVSSVSVGDQGYSLDVPILDFGDTWFIEVPLTSVKSDDGSSTVTLEFNK